MKQSESINGLLKALCSAQAELPTMPKDTEGYGYKYTNLDTIVATIKPILAKHGLGYIQPITTAFLEGQKPCMAITTRIFNADGEYIEDTAALPEISVGKTNAAQNVGAAITYMRRYGLCSMLGITSDEDVDGNVQTHQEANARPAQKQGSSKPANKSAGNTPKGGFDTPEQHDTINKLLSTKNSSGQKIFNANDVANIGAWRVNETAEQVIQKLRQMVADRMQPAEIDQQEELDKAAMAIF